MSCIFFCILLCILLGPKGKCFINAVIEGENQDLLEYILASVLYPFLFKGSIQA